MGPHVSQYILCADLTDVTLADSGLDSLRCEFSTVIALLVKAPNRVLKSTKSGPK